ncbi:MAG: hypothetical protein JWN01_633 [Patescibacteria group bacterium]|nr:hypothetical protein [Patescibacteria group bacterium]
MSSESFEPAPDPAFEHAEVRPRPVEAEQLDHGGATPPSPPDIEDTPLDIVSARAAVSAALDQEVPQRGPEAAAAYQDIKQHIQRSTDLIVEANHSNMFRPKTWRFYKEAKKAREAARDLTEQAGMKRYEADILQGHFLDVVNQGSRIDFSDSRGEIVQQHLRESAELLAGATGHPLKVAQARDAMKRAIVEGHKLGWSKQKLIEERDELFDNLHEEKNPNSGWPRRTKTEQQRWDGLEHDKERARITALAHNDIHNVQTGYNNWQLEQQYGNGALGVLRHPIKMFERMGHTIRDAAAIQLELDQELWKYDTRQDPAIEEARWAKIEHVEPVDESKKLAENLRLGEQYQGQISLLRETGLVTNLPSGELGYRGVDARSYPVPTQEQVAGAVEAANRNGELDTKLRQGFDTLLLVPFGLPLEESWKKYGAAVKERAQTDPPRTYEGEPLKPHKSKPVVESSEGWGGPDVRADVKYSPGFGKPSKTKKETLESGELTIPGWKVVLVQDFAEARPDNYTVKIGGLPGLILRDKYLFPVGLRLNDRLKKLAADPAHAGESGMDYDTWIMLALKNLYENNRVIDSEYYSVLPGSRTGLSFLGMAANYGHNAYKDGRNLHYLRAHLSDYPGWLKYPQENLGVRTVVAL